MIMEEMKDSKKYGLMFLFIFITAFIIIATLIFPFWNLIREDVYEGVEIMGNGLHGMALCAVWTLQIIFLKQLITVIKKYVILSL